MVAKQGTPSKWYNKPYCFLTNWRHFPAYELVSYFFMFASIPMLAYGIQVYSEDIIRIIILSIITLYSGFFAALIWNDITDADIDAIVHPKRPVPEGRISTSLFFIVALVFSASTFIFGLMTSMWCLGIVGFIALFVAFHNKFLKKRVKIPAYSEVFTPLQWLAVAMFGYFAIWTVIPQQFMISIDLPLLGLLATNSFEFQNMVLLVLFTYFSDNAHDLPEGIHDVSGDLELGVRTYATSFGVKTAGKVSFGMFVLSLVLGIVLFVRTGLSYVFLVLFIITWIWAFRWYRKLLSLPDKGFEQIGKEVGRKGYDYFLMVFNLMFLDIFLQILNVQFNIL